MYLDEINKVILIDDSYGKKIMDGNDSPSSYVKKSFLKEEIIFMWRYKSREITCRMPDMLEQLLTDSGYLTNAEFILVSDPEYDKKIVPSKLVNPKFDKIGLRIVFDTMVELPVKDNCDEPRTIDTDISKALKLVESFGFKL